MSKEFVPSLGFNEVLKKITLERFVAGMKPAEPEGRTKRDRGRNFTVATQSITGARRRIVVLVHGSNTLGDWARELDQALANNAEGIDVRPIAFEPMQIWKPLLFPLSRSRLRDIDDQICAVIDEMLAGDELSIVAHSYGTQLVMRWLNWRRGTKCKCVILLGSIVRRKWFTRATSRTDKIYNFVAVRDEIVCRAEAYASFFYEATGTFGVRQKIKNVYNYFVDADHGDIVTLKFLNEFVLPIIDGRGLPPQERIERTFDHRIIWEMRRPLVLLIGLIGIILILLGNYFGIL